jgi:hypothetical protein
MERHLPQGRRHGTERTTREGGKATIATVRGQGREGSLEGEQGPGEDRLTGAVQTVAASTDSLAEQRPEGQRALRHQHERRGWQRQRRDGG